jgi:hypothetical protein
MRRRHRDSDTGADLHLMAREQKRLRDKLRYPGRQIGRAGDLFGALGLYDRKFVASQARQHVGAA